MRSPGTRVPFAAGVLALAAAGLVLRLLTLPPAPDVDDSFLFVKGVIRFSILETRPHWPGYPVYIWIGKVVRALVGDPVLALHLVSAVASALMAWPLASLTREWTASRGGSAAQSAWTGWAAAALWLVTPMAWVTGGQIISDPVGLLMGLLALVACVKADRGSGPAGPWPAVGGAVLAGLMVGVRLVNATMLAPFAWLAWRSRGRRWRGVPAPLVLALAVSAGAASWLGWMVAREPGFLTHHASSHLSGHFQGWGESLLTDRRPVTRPIRALRTVAVHGLGTGGPALGWRRLVVGMAWATVLALAVRRRPFHGRVAGYLALWLVPHLLYVFLAHDVGYPRYMFSAVAALAMLGGTAAAAGGMGLAAVGAAVVSMLAVSAPLASLQSRSPLVEYRVGQFLLRHEPVAIAVVAAPALPFVLSESAPAVVWTDTTAEEVRRWRERWEKEGRRVFTTAPPPDEPDAWVPAAHFCRDPLIDPRYGYDIWLFAPRADAAGGIVEDCD